MYPVDLEYLKALSHVGGIHRQTTSTRHKPHEQYPLIIAEWLENVPEPPNKVMCLINLTVPTVVRQWWLMDMFIRHK